MIDSRRLLKVSRYFCVVRRSAWPRWSIQQQLGHASLATTQRYLDHLAPVQVVELMQRREWDI